VTLPIDSIDGHIPVARIRVLKMARHSVIIFLLASVLTATLPHADGFARGSARFLGAPAAHRFREGRLGHRFPNAPFFGTAIGDLTDGDAVYASPNPASGPAAAAASGLEPAAVDFPSCSETGSGGVTVMRGGACDYRHPSK
jgi:hypothetical protein